MSKICIICGSNKFREVIRKSGCAMIKCLGCGLVFTDPLPTEQELDKYYQQTYQVDLDGYFNKKSIFEYYLNCIESFAWKGRNLLEIGCSYGLFLKIARERGWQVNGIELSSEGRTYAETRFGLTVYDRKLKDTPLFVENRFDGVALWHVLEHFQNPYEELQSINYCLKPGGIIAVVLPNFGSLQARSLNRYWEWIDPYAHLYQFDLSTLKKLLRKAGFEIVYQKTQRGDSKGLLAHIIYYFFRLICFGVKWSGIIYLKLREKIGHTGTDNRIDQFKTNLGRYFEKVFWPVILKMIRPVDYVTHMIRNLVYKKMLGPEMFVLAKKI